MPWFLQMVGFGLLLLGIAVALWISVWVLAFFLIIGVMGVLWSHLREFLVEQGILNPKYRHAPIDEAQDAPSVTIVDADFTRVDETTKIPENKE